MVFSLENLKTIFIQRNDILVLMNLFYASFDLFNEVPKNVVKISNTKTVE